MDVALNFLLAFRHSPESKCISFSYYIQLNEYFSVNRQQRRQAQCLLFRAWFKRNPELFKGMTDPAIAAYDAAETIYVGCSFFDVELTEHVCHLTEADFSPQEWKIVSLISRRSGSTFEIRIKTNPPVSFLSRLYLIDAENLKQEF